MPAGGSWLPFMSPLDAGVCKLRMLVATHTKQVYRCFYVHNNDSDRPVRSEKKRDGQAPTTCLEVAGCGRGAFAGRRTKASFQQSASQSQLCVSSWFMSRKWCQKRYVNKKPRFICTQSCRHPDTGETPRSARVGSCR